MSETDLIKRLQPQCDPCEFCGAEDQCMFCGRDPLRAEAAEAIADLLAENARLAAEIEGMRERETSRLSGIRTAIIKETRP